MLCRLAQSMSASSVQTAATVRQHETEVASVNAASQTVKKVIEINPYLLGTMVRGSQCTHSLRTCLSCTFHPHLRLQLCWHCAHTCTHKRSENVMFPCVCAFVCARMCVALTCGICVDHPLPCDSVLLVPALPQNDAPSTLCVCAQARARDECSDSETSSLCRQGERLLLHAAAGGVGLAALQVLQASGCIPIATAGSPAKRSVIRQMGHAHVLNSRDASFVEDIALLGGAQALLNSMTTPGLIAASLSGRA